MYASIIVDEADERTTDLDILLALLEKVVKTRLDFKVGAP